MISKSKKVGLSRIFLAIAIVIMISIWLPACNSSSFDKELMTAASELNKNCPVMVDKETRLDNAVALPDKVFQYNYTLVNLAKDSFDADAVKKTLEPTVVNQVKTSPDLKIFRDNKVTLSYCYKDKTGILLFNILVKPEQYAN